MKEKTKDKSKQQKKQKKEQKKVPNFLLKEGESVTFQTPISNWKKKLKFILYEANLTSLKLLKQVF